MGIRFDSETLNVPKEKGFPVSIVIPAEKLHYCIDRDDIFPLKN